MVGPPGSQAPVVKASQCRNERQKMTDRGKVGRKGSGKKYGESLRQSLNIKIIIMVKAVAKKVKRHGDSNPLSSSF